MTLVLGDAADKLRISVLPWEMLFTGWISTGKAGIADQLTAGSECRESIFGYRLQDDLAVRIITEHPADDKDIPFRNRYR